MRRASKGPRLRSRTKQRATSARREVVYDREWQRWGCVLCFVCRKHVSRRDATLEHIVPRSRGGGDGFGNLAISHGPCNWARGNKLIAHRADRI